MVYTDLHGGRIFLYSKELTCVLIPYGGMGIEQGMRKKGKKTNQGDGSHGKEAI